MSRNYNGYQPIQSGNQAAPPSGGSSAMKSWTNAANKQDIKRMLKEINERLWQDGLIISSSYLSASDIKNIYERLFIIKDKL